MNRPINTRASQKSVAGRIHNRIDDKLCNVAANHNQLLCHRGSLIDTNNVGPETLELLLDVFIAAI